MGPKRFETWVHCMGLIIRQVFRLSYRRTAKFLDEYFDILFARLYGHRIRAEGSTTSRTWREPRITGASFVTLAPNAHRHEIF